MPPEPMGRFEVCGVPIDAHTVESAAQALVHAASSGKGSRFHLCNAHVLSLADEDRDYARLLAAGDVNLPDGTPVVWTAHRLGLSEALRVPGTELFSTTVRLGVKQELRHYLYGSTTTVVAQLVEGLRASAPEVRIVGMESPPFRDLTDAEFDQLCDRIVQSGAQVVWVGLGTPRQDLLMQRLRDRLPVVTVAVGAAFDFLGGQKQRAPEWMQRVGLEWLHRLFDEPGRLWKRYLVGNGRYLLAAQRTGRLLERNDDAIARSTASPARSRRSTAAFVRALVIADLAVIGAGSTLAYALRETLGESGQLGPFQNELPTALAVLPLWLVILYGFGCYRPQFQNQSSEAFRRFLAATTVGVLVLGFASFLFRLDLSRVYVGVMFLSVLAFGSGVRGAIRVWLRRQRSAGRLQRNVLLVGADDEAKAVAKAMQGYDVAGYRVVGFVADDQPAGSEVTDGLHVLGTTDQIVQVAADHDVSLAVISPTAVAAGTLQDLAIRLEDHDVDLAVAPSLFEVVTRRVTVESVANVPILHIDQIRLVGWKAVAKRAFDLTFAVALSLLSLPVIVVAALAIKLSDGGPVLFAHRRVGKDGRVFRLYKFRTMVPDAEERRSDLDHLNEAGQHFFKIRHDPRVTSVGRFLRKWSIDEIPQFWNVIRGDMSMVGPRPPMPNEVARYEPWHRRRLRIKPGITGVWQVSGRSEVPFDEAVRLDLFYIENWSLGYDLFLLAKTVIAVLGRSGAY